MLASASKALLDEYFPSFTIEVVINASVDIRPVFAIYLADQQAHFEANRYPEHAQRVADLKALIRLVADNRYALVAAVDQDYGCRSTFETTFAEFAVTLDGLHNAIKQLKKCMKPQKLRVDPMLLPLASARLIPQPIGVVGVIVPWSLPITMVFHPLSCIFAAGNCAMAKMSENSSHFAQLLRNLTPHNFPAGKLAFLEDGGGRGPAFTSLAFDHIFFAGSPTTGKAVMASAARNLTPVTLELGGKSPAVVAADFPIETAAQRILWAKTFDAGQICPMSTTCSCPKNSLMPSLRQPNATVRTIARTSTTVTTWQ